MLNGLATRSWCVRFVLPEVVKLPMIQKRLQM